MGWLRRSLVPLLVLGCGLFLGFWHSGYASLWGDEGPTIIAARRSWLQLAILLTHIDAVHGLYYSFVKIWCVVFGYTEFGLRSLSGIGYACAGLAVYFLARRFGGLAFAITTAAFFLLIPRNLYNAGYGRSYALSTMMAVLVTIAFLRLLDTQGQAWLRYLVLAVIGTYLFEYMALLLLAQLAVVLLIKNHRLILRTMLRMAAFWLAAVFPVLIFSYLERYQISPNSRVHVSAESILVHQWFATIPAAWLCWGVLVLGLLCHRTVREVRAAVRNRGWDAPTAPLLAFAWMLVPTVTLVVVNRFVPVFALRYLSFCTPAVALLMAGIVNILRPRILATVAVAAVAAIVLPTALHTRLVPTVGKTPSWRSVAQTIEHYARPGDAIAITPMPNFFASPRMALQVYPDAFKATTDVLLAKSAVSLGSLYYKVYSPKLQAQRFDAYQRIWVVENAKHQDWAIAEIESRGFRQLQRIVLHKGEVLEFVKN